MADDHLAAETNSAVEVVADSAVVVVAVVEPSDGRRTSTRKNIIVPFYKQAHSHLYVLLAVVLSNVLGRSCSVIM